MRGDKKYLAFTLLFLTILGVLFYHFIHLEKMSEIENMETDIKRINNEIILVNKFNAKHKHIGEEISTLAERHFRVIEAYPETLNEENIIDYLHETARDNKLEIVNLNSVELRNDIKHTASFKAKVRGDYFNILNYLFVLYNSHKFIDITGVDLKNNDGILTLDLDINCYYSKQNKTGEK